jgi:hypothetical protein
MDTLKTLSECPDEIRFLANQAKSMWDFYSEFTGMDRQDAWDMAFRYKRVYTALMNLLDQKTRLDILEELNERA